MEPPVTGIVGGAARRRVGRTAGDPGGPAVGIHAATTHPSDEDNREERDRRV
ncbi:MAG TPA: hypothetical protein VKU91_03360 [Acidimicrobiales bacterium]|nr:hypothetical protein [Acidimicrobiales bacterium]